MRNPIACIVGLSAVLLSGLAAAAERPADLVVTGARVYTVDAKRSTAQALAIRDGKFIYVGSNSGSKAFVGPATKVEDAAGRLILPGLFDSHIHATGIVQFDVCDLKSASKTLAELGAFVRDCIDRYHVKDGEWLVVRQWNPYNGNEPDAARPTVRAALDLASRGVLIELLGNDGHHGGFNSAALQRARNAAGKTVGYSRATLATDFHSVRKLVGVDDKGEPNGNINEDARGPMGTPSFFDLDMKDLAKVPEKVSQLLNEAGITGILDAAAHKDAIDFYADAEQRHVLTVRATLAQYYDPDRILTADGKPDWDKMVGTAKQVRTRFAHDPLISANYVKLFADGVLEGNPYATPPTLPEVASIRPYLQPIFGRDAHGHPQVSGYVDTASQLCEQVRAHAAQFEAPDVVAGFTKEHGYHPDQCTISMGQLQHSREVILEYAKRFHLAGFNVHIHAIGDMPVRTAVDAIEAARKADGITTTHDALAHIQLAHPDDVARIGRDHLYLAYTYAWAYTDPEYDMSVVPFIDHVKGSTPDDLHPADGYYERNAYPVRSTKDAGAVLVAGSDAPVDTRDPRPFVNMQMAVARAFNGHRALNPAQRISLRDVIDAYTINGAQYLNLDRVAGSIEKGKSADFILLDQDILALADGG
jgi:predicted amidohydrolase YtcJ